MNFNNKVLTFSFQVPADLVYGLLVCNLNECIKPRNSDFSIV